ncbi:MAG TPA: hypothetical protein VGV13_12860 [Methylomirabilota bacterium]|nr:hypothetical protein [Methylomirabilota bacterium]
MATFQGEAADLAKLRLALSAPMVAGQSLAGVRLGSSESDVVRDLGAPDRVSSSLSIKVADYLEASNTWLRIFLRDGRVDAILIAVLRLDSAPSFSAGLRGVGLGSTVGAVRNAFGPGTDGRLWYPQLGVAFNPADRERPDNERVYAVLVLKPGPNDMVEAYGRLAH